eukprot:5546512-Amphidinium_carterae.1
MPLTASTPHGAHGWCMGTSSWTSPGSWGHTKGSPYQWQSSPQRIHVAQVNLCLADLCLTWVHVVTKELLVDSQTCKCWTGKNMRKNMSSPQQTALKFCFNEGQGLCAT